MKISLLPLSIRLDLRADTAATISRKEPGNSENLSSKLRYQLIPIKRRLPDLWPQKVGSTIPVMPRNYSDNATKPGCLIVTLWTKDTILKRFTDWSEKTCTPIQLSLFAPGIMRSSVVNTVRKWLVCSITWFIQDDNSWKQSFISCAHSPFLSECFMKRQIYHGCNEKLEMFW